MEILQVGYGKHNTTVYVNDWDFIKIFVKPNKNVAITGQWQWQRLEDGILIKAESVDVAKLEQALEYEMYNI